MEGFIPKTTNEKKLAAAFAFILVVDVLIGYRIDSHDEEVERLRIHNQDTWSI